jgi:UDP-N-acetylglucosamine 1-carboxyvinyltransferase
MIRIQGGRRLKGSVEVAGSKNAALPLLFACLLSDDDCHLTGLPDVADIRTAARLLERLGANVERHDPSSMTINCSGVDQWEAPYDLVRTMRASFLVLGPLLARFGRARVSMPGGCAIGARPVDVHLSALRLMGARIETVRGYEEASTDGLKGAHIILEKPSVGATENLLMAASLARGSTRLENAAREPEVVDLARALQKMGANISGAGSSVVEIEGVERLGGMTHRVIPDRIEAGTFLIAAAMTRGEVTVKGARAEDLRELVTALESAGAVLRDNGDGMTAR